jgi:MFS family permease
MFQVAMRTAHHNRCSAAWNARPEPASSSRVPARWPAVVYCLLSWAGAFHHLILFSFLKRDVRDALGLSEVTLGWIDGLTFAAAAAGGLALGRLADLGGRRIALALAPALPAVGSWILSSADSAATVFVARIVVGFGVGGGWGVGHAVLASLYDGRARLRAAAILQTGGPIGVMAAALAGAVLAPAGAGGWRTVLACSAVTAAIAALDPWAMSRAASVPQPADAPAAPARDWSRPAARIFALLVLQMAAYWCTFGWLPSHLIGLGVARRTVGWIQLATAVTQAVADIGFGWLSPRAGLRRLFAICNLAFGSGVLAMALAFDTVASSPFALAATICAVGLGSGSWAAFGPLYAAHVPPSVRSSVSSFSYHLARATQLVVQPAVAGLATVAARGGSHATTLVVAAVAAWAGALMVRRLPPAGGP